MEKRYCWNRHGISNIELILTIVIVGILGGLAIPNSIKMMERIKIYTTTLTIKRMINTAKSKAISDVYVHCGIHFDFASTPNKVFLFFDDELSTQNKYDANMDKIYLHIYTVPNSITVKLPNAGGIQNQAIVFRGDGSARTGGSVLVASKKYGTLYPYLIHVLPSTGRVRISKEK